MHKNTKACIHAKTKLILISTDGPKHADPPPADSGHYIESGKMSTNDLAVYMSVIATISHKSWKIT